MKTLKIKFRFFSLSMLFVSLAFLMPCEAQKTTGKHVQSSELKNEPFLKVVIDSPKIEGDKDKFLSSLNSSLLKKSGLQTNLNTLKVEQFEGKYYLIAQGDEYRTVMEMEDTSSQPKAMLAKKETVTCTTSNCSSGSGCSPSNGRCTSCLFGDCTRTITTTNGLQTQIRFMKKF